MPGPLEQQALLTPYLVQHNINMRKAQQIYASRLQQHLHVPIGEPINPDPDSHPRSWLRFILSDAGASGRYDMCCYVKYATSTYDTIIGLISADISNKYDDPLVAANSNAELQDKLLTLTKERDDLLEDQQVAELRNNALRSGNVAITNHQVYLLGRPLRPASIPYIWALSVLFIGLGLLIFYTFMPYTLPPFDIILLNIYFFFSNAWVWSTLFGLASIVILFLSLRIANII